MFTKVNDYLKKKDSIHTLLCIEVKRKYGHTLINTRQAIISYNNDLQQHHMSLYNNAHIEDKILSKVSKVTYYNYFYSFKFYRFTPNYKIIFEIFFST